jgi:hypothetical protein
MAVTKTFPGSIAYLFEEFQNHISEFSRDVGSIKTHVLKYVRTRSQERYDCTNLKIGEVHPMSLHVSM